MDFQILTLAAFAVAQLADVITTARALRRGGREANPVIRGAMDRLGRHGWIVVKLGGAGVLAWVSWSAGALWALWLVTAITAAVAVNNATVGR